MFKSWIFQKFYLQVGPFGFSESPDFPFVLEAKQLVFSTLSLILKTLEQLESLDQIASLYVLNNY